MAGEEEFEEAGSPFRFGYRLCDAGVVCQHLPGLDSFYMALLHLRYRSAALFGMRYYKAHAAVVAIAGIGALLLYAPCVGQGYIGITPRGFYAAAVARRTQEKIVAIASQLGGLAHGVFAVRCCYGKRIVLPSCRLVAKTYGGFFHPGGVLRGGTIP